MKKKFTIEEVEPFVSGHGDKVRVFLVIEPGQERWDAAHVWLSDRARCTKCSGLLSAMLSSCKHARAVKRHHDIHDERKS